MNLIVSKSQKQGMSQDLIKLGYQLVIVGNFYSSVSISITSVLFHPRRHSQHSRFQIN